MSPIIIQGSVRPIRTYCSQEFLDLAGWWIRPENVEDPHDK